MTGIAIAAVVIAVPFIAFALWPLVRRRTGAVTFLALPPDAREQLTEQKRQALRALRELEFEHDAGHVSDDDYRDLRARYETEAAAVIRELDRLGTPAEPRPRKAATAPASARSAWSHPAAITVSAIALVVFGLALGVGIVRYSAPNTDAGMPQPGSRPLAALGSADAGRPGSPAGSSGSPRAVTPEVLQGMLQAARTALFEGQYAQAIAAYEAILKRDPKNVDAMTHLGLIVAIGGHADSALSTFDKALSIDASYPPALLYRGQILYDSKKDVPGAVSSWEKYLALAPAGEDRDRVTKMIAEAKAGTLRRMTPTIGDGAK